LWLFSGIGVTLVGFIPPLRRLIARLLIRRRAKVDVFTTAQSPYMDDFYDMFTKKIATARQNVYISGEGFDCTTSEGRKRAQGLVDAERDALRNGANIVRLQTRMNVDPDWLKHLKELLTDHPHAFELYALNDPNSFDTASVCAIDVEDYDNNCSEFMLQLGRHFGTVIRDVAGTAVFVSRHQLLAEAIRNRILAAAKDPQIATRIRTENYADAFFRGEYYFAYGSNMCQSQMLSRCPSAIGVSPGVLSRHRLVFNRRGSYRPGGVASIEGAGGERVYGMIWKISRQEFQYLDEMEDPAAYEREELTVHSLQGKPFVCHVYRAIPDGTIPPDPEYLKQLVECAKKAELPSGYIHSLESLSFDPPRG
jgi:cation transport regulator ChaC